MRGYNNTHECVEARALKFFFNEQINMLSTQVDHPTKNGLILEPLIRFIGNFHYLTTFS